MDTTQVIKSKHVYINRDLNSDKNEDDERNFVLFGKNTQMKGTLNQDDLATQTKTDLVTLEKFIESQVKDDETIQRRSSANSAMAGA